MSAAEWNEKFHILLPLLQCKMRFKIRYSLSSCRSTTKREFEIRFFLLFRGNFIFVFAGDWQKNKISALVMMIDDIANKITELWSSLFLSLSCASNDCSCWIGCRLHHRWCGAKHFFHASIFASPLSRLLLVISCENIKWNEDLHKKSTCDRRRKKQPKNKTNDVSHRTTKFILIYNWDHLMCVSRLLNYVRSPVIATQTASNSIGKTASAVVRHRRKIVHSFDAMNSVQAIVTGNDFVFWWDELYRDHRFFFFQSNSFLVAARLCGQMGFGDCVWIRYAYDDISRNAQLANDRTWKNMGNYYVRMFWFAIDSSAVRNAERRLSLSLRVSSLATRPLLNCIKLMFSDSF